MGWNRKQKEKKRKYKKLGIKERPKNETRSFKDAPPQDWEHLHQEQTFVDEVPDFYDDDDTEAA